jgi:hypothetical protein
MRSREVSRHMNQHRLEGFFSRLLRVKGHLILQNPRRTPTQRGGPQVAFGVKQPFGGVSGFHPQPSESWTTLPRRAASRK